MFTVVPKSRQTDHRSTVGKHGPKVINHRAGWKSVATNASRTDEDNVKQQRNALLETELQYKKRIRVLENEIAVLMKAYEETSEQNKAYVGIIEHGPAAVKVKRLNIDKRELRMKIEKLEEENDNLKGAIKGLEKKHRMKHGCGLEDEIFNKREQDSKLIQGPFKTKSYIKEQKASESGNPKSKDRQYVRINSLEQETHMLLNKISRLKQEKNKISDSLQGKGAVIRNYPIAKALKEKLEGDIDKYEEQLGKLSKKLDSYKMNYDVTANEDESIEFRPDKSTYSSRSKVTDSAIKSPTTKPSRDNTRQTNKNQGSSRSNRQSPESHRVAESNSAVNQIKETLAKEEPETNGISIDSDRARQNKPTRKSLIKTSSRQSNGSSSSKPQHVSQPNTSRDSNRDADASKPTSSKLKTGVQHSISRDSNREVDLSEQTSPKLNIGAQPSTSRDSNIRDNVSNRRSAKTGSETSENTGRYTHGPEPIGYRKRGVFLQRKPVAVADPVQTSRTRRQTKHGTSRSSYQPFPSADREHSFDEDFDTIHERLRYKELQSERMLRYDSFPTLPNGDILSPIPIRFKENLQVLDRDEVKLLVGKHALAEMDDPEGKGRRGPWKPY